MRKHRSVGITKTRVAIVVSLALAVAGLAMPAFAGGLPSISGFSPSSGSPGTLVTVNGSNFTGVTAVGFNGTATTFSFVGDGQVMATVPTGATSGKISLTTSNGTAQSASDFVVTGSVPTITGFSPSSGPAGTLVTVNGTNFTGVSSVKFNGANATFNVANAGQLTASVPASATTGKISVVATGGTAVSASNFSVSVGDAPTITSIDPTSGPIGTSVVIKGSKFGGATSVRFNGVIAVFKVNKGSKITATVPSGATTGPISVTTPSGAASSGTFSVTAGLVPTITSLSPTSGAIGVSVRINGTNLTGATSVKFNGVVAMFSVDNGSRITTHVPVGATTGPVTVVTPAGTATSAAFTVIGAGPVIGSFKPMTGKAGDAVTIKGSKFTGATSVTFNGVAAVFTVSGDGKIKATVPAKARTGKIAVTTPSGTTTSADDFTVVVILHHRHISLSLSGRLNAAGSVGVGDDYKACSSQIPVVIQRLRGGVWRWVATTATRKNGDYRIFLRNRRGAYRAIAKRITLANGQICGKDLSRTVMYHR